MKKTLFITALMISFVVSQANAQFFKKLKDRVIEKTQEVVADKTAEKVAEKAGDATDDAMDKLLNFDFGDLTIPGGKKVDLEKLPASYNFDYRYALKITTHEGEVDFDYFLNKTEPYMGMKMNMGTDMSMVFDEGNKVVYTNMNGMAIATEMDMSDVMDEEDVGMYSDYTFKELPSREFLGYSCVGREMENDEYKFVIYIAPDMEAGFGNMFKSEHANIPPAMQKFSQEYKNGLMMYMDMVEKKNKNKGSVNMECVAFEPTNLVIKTR